MAAASMGGGEQFGDGGGGRWRPAGASASQGAGRGGILGVLDLTGRDWGRGRRAAAYDRTAYEEAPRIRHGGDALRVALSPRAAYGVIGGAATAALLLFVAGFLAAFWLVAPDGGVARGPAPAQPMAQQAVEPAAPAAAAAPGPGLIARATAGDAPETPAPPAPEIEAAARATQAQPQPIAAPQQLAALPEPSAPDEAEAPRARLKPADAPPPAPRAQSATFTAPSADAAPAARAEPISAVTGAYALQFGAFRERANAEELLGRIPTSLGARLIEGRDSAGAPLFYVRAGGFESVAEARRRSAELEASAGLKSFVRRGRDG